MYGHYCELKKETDNILPVLLPGASLWSHFKRRFLKLLLVSDTNPRSKLYLRSRAAIAFEKRRHARSHNWYIIHPFSTLRSIWETIMIVILMCSLIIIPYNIAFYNHGKKGSERTVFERLFKLADFTCSIICCVDVGINFLTGFYLHATKEIILDPLRIARNYVRGFFIFDLLSSLPIGDIVVRTIDLSNVTDIVFTMTLVDCIAALKVMRLKTLIQYTIRLGMKFEWKHKTIRLFRLCMILIVFVHWMGCLHFLIPILVRGKKLYTNPKYERQSKSWIHEMNMHNKSMIIQYYFSLFRAVCNTVGIGYGHGTPTAMEDIIVTTINIIAGALLYIYAFVVLVHIMISDNASQAKYQEIMNQLKEYMRQKKVPRHLQSRLIMHYNHCFQKNFFREKAILNTLSDHLRKEILIHCCQRLVENVPLFINLPKPIINSIITCLKHEVFLPNDVIVKAGDHGESMYFITSGTVAVLTPTGKEMCHLEDNSYFGEVALVMEDDKRMASVIAVEICELYRLDRQDFKRIVVPYPDLYSRIERIAVQRAEQTLIMEEEHNRYLLEKSIKPWAR